MAVNESRTQTRLSDQVAEEIRALLARRRVTGRELARRMGESPSWVNFRLSGHTQVAINDLPRFAEALDVSVMDLLPAEARQPRITAQYSAPPTGPTAAPARPIDNRPARDPAAARVIASTRPGNQRRRVGRLAA